MSGPPRPRPWGERLDPTADDFETLYGWPPTRYRRPPFGARVRRAISVIRAWWRP